MLMVIELMPKQGATLSDYSLLLVPSGNRVRAAEDVRLTAFWPASGDGDGRRQTRAVRCEWRAKTAMIERRTDAVESDTYGTVPYTDVEITCTSCTCDYAVE